MSKVGRRRKPEAGFTLVEMIIVVAIIAVLSAILSLSIRQIRASFALRRAATIATAEVRRAQAATIAEQVSYTVEFVLANPGPGGLRIYRAQAADGSCPPGMVATPPALCIRTVAGENWPPAVGILVDSNPPPLPLLPDPLPACTPPLGTSGNKCLTFGFLGAPVDAGNDVLLRGETGQTVRIVVAPSTGRVSVQ